MWHRGCPLMSLLQLNRSRRSRRSAAPTPGFPLGIPCLGSGTVPDDHIYRMQTFWQWLRLQNLLEAAWYSFDPQAYNRLFNDELEKVIARTSDPAPRQALERLKGFDWLSYIVGSVWHAGYRDQRERDEKSHEVVTKLLLGKLFRGYAPRIHGPMDLRFRRSVGNAIRNLVEKERNRKRLLPTTSIAQEFTPGCATPDDLPAPSAQDDDSKVIENFRDLVRRRLGGLGLAVLDVRLEGGETKSLVGCPALGSPGKWTIKKVVAGIKTLAREFFRGDPELLRRVERAMEAEGETVGKRRAAMAARVGAA